MRIVIVLLLLICLACQKQKVDFSQFNSNISYKTISLGDEAEINLSDPLFAYLTVLDKEGDTMHYVPNYKYLVQRKQKALDSLVSQFNLGDSIVVRLPRATVNEYFDLYKPLQLDTGVVLLQLKLLDQFPEDSISIKTQMMVAEREVAEQESLKKFLKKHPEFESFEEVYRKIEKRTEGKLLHFGDEVAIQYQGKFLNGYVFDDSKETGLTPTFQFGKEFQLIDGVHKGIIGLREGESVKIILPSRHAFGEEGSLAGIVPPYTAVLFDIEILKISD